MKTTAKPTGSETGKVQKVQGKDPQTSKKKNFQHTSFYELPDGSFIEQCYDSINKHSRFARWDGHEVQYHDSLPPKEGDLTLKPHQDEMAEKGVVLFPSEAVEYGSELELQQEIQEFIHKYLEISLFYEKLASYYVMFTWVYDRFSNLPYLRALGDYGTGKSRTIETIGSICYKPIFAGGATTPSPIFRLIDKYRGTLILDEADFTVSDAKADITKILNCGHSDRFPVIRSESKGDTFEPKSFRVFGPKILATRYRWQDEALESRCLTEILRGKQREDVPEILTDDFGQKALKLRNQLLMFRFRRFGSVQPDLTLRESSIETRLNQVMSPLASTIQDTEMRESLKELMRDYNKEIISKRGTSVEAEVLEAIYCLNQKEGTEKIRIKNITEYLKSEKEKNITPEKVSSILRKKFNIYPGKDRKGAYVLYKRADFLPYFERFGIPSTKPEDPKPSGVEDEIQCDGCDGCDGPIGKGGKLSPPAE